ncbi:MAG: hypothetical protein M9894_09860 [Planctomycetes bacterium]|nr:hypothetical protein [Planctomycetota bacterium]
MNDGTTNIPANTGKISLKLKLPEKGIAFKLPEKGIALTLPNTPPTGPQPRTALSAPEKGLPLKLPETQAESAAQQPLPLAAVQFEPMDDFEIYCHEPSPGRF